MSVVSSRTVSSVSSMLKDSGVRAQFIKQPDKIYKPPKDIKDILHNYKGIRKKEYDKLIHSLKNCVVKDSNLAEFINETMQYISLLDNEHKLFVEALLQIDWTTRSSQVIFTYKLFLQNLACMQTFHTNIVINCLVELFKPKNNTEHEIGQFKDEDIERLNHIHDILREILRVVPMSNNDLLEAIELHFPFHLIHGTYVHEIYLHALLEMLNYAPQLRRNMFILIIQKLVTLDVNIPCEEANNKDIVEDDCINNGTSDNDNLTKINSDTDKSRTVHPVARILDSCMELFFKFIHEFCFVNDVLQIKNLEILCNDIVYAFEKEILNMYGIRYVQYIMFYICSFGFSTIKEKFINWLWQMVVKPNPTVPPIYRQTAICYISSMLATASFISPQLVETMISKMTQWLNKYITSQECSEYIEDCAKHVVFYSVCQAFFYLFVARYKHFVFDLKYEKFLQNLSLSISKIVTCKLNPLKMCDTKIVHAFAQTTRTYGLAYCDTVIEYNERNQLPIFGMESHLSVSIPNFFPFESYTLEHSRRRIAPLFYNNAANTDCSSVNKYE
ncbi:PREDICTED: RNA polymerase I-specific transcription initiation factor RRN3 [Cyphomyrmex costatus]|uniref:RNA polymerase I-specific transcription initiation factor RRN3 n=1 Tax=Cyphomyrmex costatus TaxID=456900 RepID=A0A195D5E5_9HYME|nr:PREDICTED: RNA polymerase I-specific transcription initiation factor RRN3 [Cyphomyrmex costatus]KYN08076.1 RNA polymerase I-specific transcription initiation factor RRN3 [Cyphomyrmex costatus]